MPFPIKCFIIYKKRISTIIIIRRKSNPSCPLPQKHQSGEERWRQSFPRDQETPNQWGQSGGWWKQQWVMSSPISQWDWCYPSHRVKHIIKKRGKGEKIEKEDKGEKRDNVVVPGWQFQWWICRIHEWRQSQHGGKHNPHSELQTSWVHLTNQMPCFSPSLAPIITLLASPLFKKHCFTNLC